MESFLRDLRFAQRSIRKNRGFSIVIVATLALGIGANTAIFSFLYGILLRPYPYPDPEQLVRVFSISAKDGGAEGGNSLLDVNDFARTSRTISAIGAYLDLDSDIRGNGPAQAIQICWITEGGMRAVGVNPILGRLFMPDEDRKGGDVQKAILSYGLWKSRYGGDPNIVGKTVQTPTSTLTIVGVMPSGFGFPDRTDLWTTMESWYAIQVGQRAIKQRHHRFYRVIARLKPGIAMKEAEAELNNIAASLEKQFPQNNIGFRIKMQDHRSAATGEIRPYLLLIAAAAGLVLLICCVNVANLMLSRAVSSRREIGVRAALGASRWRLMQASLTESLVLAMAGGLLGVSLAFVGAKVMLRLVPVALPTWTRIETDLPVLAFGFLLSILTSVLFGLVPALSVSKTELSSTLKENSRTTTGGGARLGSALVVSEICLALLVLVGAGLMMQTFIRLRNQETGFQPQNLLIVRATNYKPGTRAEKAVILSQLHERVLTKLRGLPDVVSVSGSNTLPYTRVTSDRSRARLRVKGKSEEETRLHLPTAGADISPDYFNTMNIPLIKGRRFDSRDTSDSAMVVIVNERAAKMLWPDRDPIGQELFWGTDEPSPENPYCRVVGVVGNVRHLAGENDNGLELYYPYTQYPIGNIYYAIRTKSNTDALISSVRQAINSVDQNTAVVFIKSMETLIDESLWQRRLWGVLFTAFAILSLMLAVVGIYGLLAYQVTQRTREIGVRLALGAQTSSVLKLILGYGARLLIVGVVLGLAFSFGLRKLLSSMLFGVSATDPITFVASSIVLAAAAMLACYLPALRATRVSPITALREE